MAPTLQPHTHRQPEPEPDTSLSLSLGHLHGAVAWSHASQHNAGLLLSYYFCFRILNGAKNSTHPRPHHNHAFYDTKHTTQKLTWETMQRKSGVVVGRMVLPECDLLQPVISCTFFVSHKRAELR